MFFLRKPSEQQICQVLQAQSTEPFSYPEVGATRSNPPSNYPINHHRIRLGTGTDVFIRAVNALKDWTMYRLPWTEVYPARTQIESGNVFATIVQHLGFWSINPCRIVYVEQEREDTAQAFSFAIGTLPAHSERGEERFRVEWHRGDDSVWFDIYAFAGPQHWLARLGYPVVGVLQRRFGRQATDAMHARVSTDRSGLSGAEFSS
ncbi:DUF1990 domain-containing protein [Verrucomicrobiota bacterium sgz303538]